MVELDGAEASATYYQFDSLSQDEELLWTEQLEAAAEAGSTGGG